MNVDPIKNGIVIDHIKAGEGMTVYYLLKLDKLESPVAIIKNVSSKAMGKKDIIKIDEAIDIDISVLGYIDPDITVNIIKDSVLVEKKHLELPEEIVNVVKCKNPRCITSVEQEIPHRFKLTDREKRVYRCVYCEHQAKK